MKKFVFGFQVTEPNAFGGGVGEGNTCIRNWVHFVSLWDVLKSIFKPNN